MLEAFGVSDPGCVRQNNEDYYYVDPALGVYVLAEGMGGAAAGDTASRLAVEPALKHIYAGKPRSVELLVRAFEEANRQVLSAANATVELNGMGATLVGAIECGTNLSSRASAIAAHLFENGQLVPIAGSDLGERSGPQDRARRRSSRCIHAPRSTYHRSGLDAARRIVRD
jgi:hypothetical protein